MPIRPEYVYSSLPIDFWPGHVQRLTRLASVSLSLIKGDDARSSKGAATSQSARRLPVEMQPQRKQLFPLHYVSSFFSATRPSLSNPSYPWIHERQQGFLTNPNMPRRQIDCLVDDMQRSVSGCKSL